MGFEHAVAAPAFIPPSSTSSSSLASHLPSVEASQEQRTRRIVLIIFIIFYLACVPLWYVTSRVQRVSLPSLPTLTDDDSARLHSIPLTFDVLHASDATSASWSEWTLATHTQIATELDDMHRGVNHSHVAFSLRPAQRRSEDKTRTIADEAITRDDARGLSVVLDHFLSTGDSALASFSLPSWHIAIIVVDSVVPPSLTNWHMSPQRCAFTVLSTGASSTERALRVDRGLRMLQGMVQTQTCTDTPPTTQAYDVASAVDACSGSKGLSTQLSFILMNDEGDYQPRSSNFQAADAASSIEEEVWSWNFHQIQHAYLSRFLNVLSPFVTFAIDSTVLHYGHLTEVEPTSVQLDQQAYEAISHLPVPTQAALPTHSSSSSAVATSSFAAYELSASSLKNLIGTIGEWNIPTPLAQSSMELIVYIPPKTKRPMYVNFGAPTQLKDGTSVPAVPSPATSIFVPRFGGVAILNTPTGTCNRTTHSTKSCELSIDDSAKEVMRVFIEQIRSTLALTQSSALCPTCIYLSNRTHGISSWELDLLSSRLIKHNLQESLSVLKSLYDLLAAVPHMPVNDDIQSLVQESLRSRNSCLASLRAGDWSSAGTSCQSSVLSAHRAFFHHDMLPALYFPDEHLYAVYLPLFLPISVPLLTALLRALLGSQEKERRKKKKVVHELIQRETEEAEKAN